MENQKVRESTILILHKTKAFFTVLVAITVSMAQSVNISGKITDTTGVAISGAIVKLENAGLTATTGTDGRFTLSDALGINEHTIQPLPHRLSVKITNGVLLVSGQGNSPVEVSVYTLQGQAVSQLQKTMTVDGRHYLFKAYYQIP